MWHEAQRKQLGAKVATCAVQHVQRCRALAQLLHRKGVDNAIGTALDKLLAEIGRMEVASAARTTRTKLASALPAAHTQSAQSSNVWVSNQKD